MSFNAPLWRNMSCCYAHEQCTLANEQWSRLLDNMTGQSGKGSILQPRTSIDPCLTRLINSAEMSPASSTLLDNLPIDKRRCVSTSNHGGLMPWKSEDKRYSPGLEGLDEEIEDFYCYITPLPEEKWMRHDVVLRITHLITELWPAAKVEVFGSYATGLYLPTSDIDIVVMYCEIDAQTPDVMQKALMTLEKQLINKAAYDDVKVIRTSVPIVKFTDRETAVKVDVGFNVCTGVKSVQFIKDKLIEFPQLQCLVFVLKQFLVYHNLLESFNGGISSYCLILLVVSYLQLNCEEENISYGQHIIRFLELYGCHFNYLRTGIRIRDGGSYFPKNDRQDGESENRYQFSLLYIEDPLDIENDVGKGCYGAMKVRDAFADAYRDLRDAVLPQYQSVQTHCSTILGRILGVPHEIVQYRRLILQRHSRISNTMIYPLTENRLFMPSATPGTTDDRSDCGSVSSQTSNSSSLTKSSQCRSQSTGSGAISDNESDANSDTVKHHVPDQSRTVQQSTEQSPSVQQSVDQSRTVQQSAHAQQVINDSTAAVAVTVSQSKTASHSSRLHTAPSNEQTHSTVRLSRPSTLSVDEKASPRSLQTVVASAGGAASCTVAMTTSQGRTPRPAYSSYVVRSNNVLPPRSAAAMSQSAGKTTAVTSARSPSNRTNSGAGRYSDSGSNASCVTNGR